MKQEQQMFANISWVKFNFSEGVMVEILFMILKIIGITLICVLGMLLLSVLFILFYPIGYAITMDVHDTKESIKIQGKCGWLLNSIKFRFSFIYPEFTWKGRIFFFQLNKQKNSITSSKKIVENEESNISDIDMGIDKNADINENINSKDELDNQKWDEMENETKKEDKKDSIFQKIVTLFRKIKFTIINIYDSINLMLKRKDILVDFLYDDTHQYVLNKCKNELIYLLKKLKPRKLCLDGRVGFEDPALTGKVAAVLGVMYPFYGQNINVMPDFENKIIQGSASIKGKIFLYPILKIAMKLMIDKKVRITIKDIKNIKL